MFGPLETPSADALRLAVRRLADEDPQHRLFLRLDRRRLRWIHPRPAELDARCASLVEDGLDLTRPDRTVERLLGRDLGDEPVRLLVGPDGAGAVFSHAFADGSYINALLPELLHAARDDRAPRLPVEQAPRLFRTAARFYLTRPARIARLLGAPRGRPAPEVYGAGAPRWSVLSARSAPGFYDELRDRRAAEGRRATMAAMLFAAARRAAERRLGLAGNGLTVVADCRRYAGGHIPGSFSTGLRLAVADPRSPEAVGEALQTALAAGRPLATLVLAALGSLRSRAEAAPCRPDLCLSYLGQLRTYRDLPWLDDGVATYLGIGTPHNPGEVDLTLVELAGALQVTAIFDRGRYAPADVAALLDDLVGSPAEALGYPAPAAVR